MSAAGVPFDQVKSASLAQARRLLPEWLPGGKVKGHEFFCGSLAGEPGESMSINLDSGKWADFAGGPGESGHDLIDLKAALDHTDRVTAGRWLAAELGVTSSTNGSATPPPPIPTPVPPRENWQPIVPAPPGVPDPDPRLFAGYSMIHDYVGADFSTLFFVRRKEANGTTKKQFHWLTFGVLDGITGWHPKGPPQPRALYGLRRLVTKPDADVIVCEGEKAANEAQALFQGYACISWPGGAKAVERADWSPLTDRRVLIWPDADEEGLKAAEAIWKRLPHASVLRVDGLPKGFDAADLRVDDPAGWLRERLPPEPEPGDDVRPPEFTDEALALEFTACHKDRLRYVAAWGKWLIREPAVWRFDETMLAFDLARAICRTASAECNQDRVSSALASAKTVAAVERLAKSDRQHAATVEQWDADPWSLNTPGGIVDLRTGAMRPHRASDHLTKVTAVTPGGQCPLWFQFLDRITASNLDLQAFMQRVAGYSLTGNTDEHALFFGHGTGGNGKGVFGRN